MVSLFIRSNKAIEVNKPNGLDFHLTSHGSDWLWAAFALFAFCGLLTIGLSLTKPRTERLFYRNTICSLFVMSVLYFTMASNLGWTDIQAEFNHVTLNPESSQREQPGIRQIFYSRYVGWFLAFPPVFLNYATLTSVSWSTTLFTIACQCAFVVSLLIGSLIKSSYKWGYYCFAIVAFLLVAYNLLWNFRRASIEVGVHPAGTGLFAVTVLLLLLYPISWGLSEGGNVIEVDSEAVFYGVLDVCFFVFLGAAFLFIAKDVDFKERDIYGTRGPVFQKHHHYADHTADIANRHSGDTAIDHQLPNNELNATVEKPVQPNQVPNETV